MYFGKRNDETFGAWSMDSTRYFKIRQLLWFNQCILWLETQISQHSSLGASFNCMSSHITFLDNYSLCRMAYQPVKTWCWSFMLIRNCGFSQFSWRSPEIPEPFSLILSLFCHSQPFFWCLYKRPPTVWQHPHMMPEQNKWPSYSKDL